MIDITNMLVGQEVFVLASDELTRAVANKREFHIYDSVEDLTEGLKGIPTDLADDLRVVHGVLTRATTLPSDLNGKTAFVIAISNLDEEDGYMVEAGDTVEHVEDTVTDALTSGICGMYDIEIDYIFVVYGYELSIILSVNDDDVDDEVIDTCHQIAEEVDEILTRNSGELGELVVTPDGD